MHYLRAGVLALLATASAATAEWNAAADERNRQSQMASMRATQAANDRAAADRSFQQGLANSRGSAPSSGSRASTGSGGNSAGSSFAGGGSARSSGPQSVVATRTVTIWRQETPERAFARLSGEAAAGDAQAQWWLGRMAYAGFGTPRDDALARRSFTAAASQGHVEAAAYAGYLAVNGKGGPVDTAGGRALLRRAAESGDPFGQTNYGLQMILAANAGENIDMRPVAAMLEQAAARGNEIAVLTLGTTLYFYGVGNVPRDDARAVKYLRISAAAGQPMAMAELGRMQLLGTRGVAKDEAAGLALIRKAAAVDNANAQFLLGVGMISGQAGIPVNRAEGVRLLRASAAQKNMEAMSMYALMLSRGDLVAKDPVAAAAMAREAALQGDNPSRVLLARAHFFGQGVAVDKPEAARLARQAADEGDAEGQFLFGQMNWYGEGVAKDRPAAIRLWRKAAAQGFAEATTNLADAEIAPVAATVRD